MKTALLDPPRFALPEAWIPLPVDLEVALLDPPRLAPSEAARSLDPAGRGPRGHPSRSAPPHAARSWIPPAVDLEVVVVLGRSETGQGAFASCKLCALGGSGLGGRGRSPLAGSSSYLKLDNEEHFVVDGDTIPLL
jgi:hypothetical protein